MNEINEDTRLQLDAISTALAALQSKEPKPKPRRKIGFIQEEEGSSTSYILWLVTFASS